MNKQRCVILAELCWLFFSLYPVVAADFALFPTDPPSLTVRVRGGTVAGPDNVAVAVVDCTLVFAPPRVAEASWSEAIPHGCNPDADLSGLWKPWNAFCMLPPSKARIYGVFFRGILPDSIVLRNHDGTRTFTRGQDYLLNEEMSMILGIGDKLGKCQNRKNPKPDEKLNATFNYYEQRLDLVQVDARGRLTVKQGESATVCPVLPEPDEGCVRVAGVWVYGAHAKGPVPSAPEKVAVSRDDICMIQPVDPVAPVNPEALRHAVTKLKSGRPIGVGFFGDSIAVGCEVHDWHQYIWSPRNRGFVGMVIRDLRARYPDADVQPAWGICGAQSIFNGVLWTNATKRATPFAGEYIWCEGERPVERGGARGAAPDELVLRGDEEKRPLSGDWLILSAEQGGEAPYAVYEIQTEKAGTYHFFLRQTHKRGEVRWRLDDADWQRQPKGYLFTDADDIRRGLPLCWTDMGPVALTRGTHTLRIELLPGKGQAAYTAIDCLAFCEDPAGPWRKYRPRELKVDVVVYAMGMNGGFSEKTPREMHKATILRHIEEARDKGCAVLLVSTMENNCRLVDAPERTKKKNRDLMAEIADETGCAFADLYTAWMNQEYRGIPPESRLHNFLNHPDVVGHRLWADTILRCFDAAAAIEEPKPAHLKSMLDVPLRAPSICRGPDNTYYMTGVSPAQGTEADVRPDFHNNQGIRLWSSTDLENWKDLGLVWDMTRDPDRWHYWQTIHRTLPETPDSPKVRGISAPELHYVKTNFWIGYSMNGNGTGLLRSQSGKPEGPYQDLEAITTRGGDASLFEDTDGEVYWVWDRGWIARMKNDLTGLAEEPVLLRPGSSVRPGHAPLYVGCGGAFLFKHENTYNLVCADYTDRLGRSACHDTFIAASTNIYGPYSQRRMMIPHGGQVTVFKGPSHELLAAFSGDDPFAVCRHRPALAPLYYDGFLKHIRKDKNALTEKGPVAALEPIELSGGIRDPQILSATNGYYYLTGTTGKQTLHVPGCRLWRSKDLKTWEALGDEHGVVWYVDQAEWTKKPFFMKALNRGVHDFWAPEIHYVRGDYYIPFCMFAGGFGLLKSESGHPEGPWVSVGQLEKDGGDPTMFTDDDGSVYMIWSFGPVRIAKMNDAMDGFATKPVWIGLDNGARLGHEGASFAKMKGKYVLFHTTLAGEPETERKGKPGYHQHATYDLMYCTADKLLGPYAKPRMAVPHGGHGHIFQNKQGEWMAAMFGTDTTAPFRGRLGLLRLRVEMVDDELIIEPVDGVSNSI